MVGVALAVAAVVGSGFRQGSHPDPMPIATGSDVRAIAVPRGAAVDDPIWVDSRSIQVAYWRAYHPSLARLAGSAGRFVPIRTLRMPGCGITSADFGARRTVDEIVYRTECFRPAPTLSLSLRNLIGYAVLDLRTGVSHRFGSVQPTYVTGILSFSPNGKRAVTATGGPNPKLEWVSPSRFTVIRQGLSIAEGPRWSPDGRLIAFVGTSSETDAEVNLYTFRPDQPGNLHLVASGLKNVLPAAIAWMPHSSRWLIANVQPSHQPDGLWFFDVDSGRKALLIEGQHFGRPTISPNGRTLAVGVGIENEYQINRSEHPGLDLIRLPPLAQLRALTK